VFEFAYSKKNMDTIAMNTREKNPESPLAGPPKDAVSD
jgi:hypothetical protein